jgi:hypothetical protein
MTPNCLKLYSLLREDTRKKNRIKKKLTFCGDKVTTRKQQQSTFYRLSFPRWRKKNLIASRAATSAFTLISLTQWKWQRQRCRRRCRLRDDVIRPHWDTKVLLVSLLCSLLRIVLAHAPEAMGAVDVETWCSSGDRLTFIITLFHNFWRCVVVAVAAGRN